MKKLVFIVPVLLALVALGSFLFSAKPACTYEYGIKGNQIKFIEACNQIKRLNSIASDELDADIIILKQQQSELSKKNDEIRTLQEKVALLINEKIKEDTYAFRMAEQ